MSQSTVPVRNVCLIGCGVICRNHLEVLSRMEDVRLCAVCDIIPERAQKAAAQYHCKAYTDYRVMLEEIRPDAVHVCLPHFLHAPVSVDCMLRGADVLCEKPMHSDYEGALSMKETAKKTGRRLGIIFQNRYNSGSVFARDAIREGKIGRVLGITATVMWHRDDAYYASDEWRGRYETAGGGVLINQAIHTLDLMRWLADSEVESVKATVSHHGLTRAEVEDTSEGVILFENGVRGLYYFSINNSFDDSISVKVHGERGNIHICGSRARLTDAQGNVLEDEEHKAPNFSPKAVYGTGHALQIDEFYHHPEKVEQTMENALKTQKLIRDIFESAGP
ncbi:MAG: Gfo/Idh/MocA family oxidoreductase [Clostridia bacterium]|nr:Gfo/Idh/MocA family oxidoreductase [Clostridia bacterium]